MTQRVVGSRRPAIRHAAVSLAVLGWLVGPAPGARVAGAGHGGVVELNRAAAGPYLLSVWTQPSPPAVGPWRVDIVVMGKSGVPVMSAAVRVRAEPLQDGGAPVEVEALRDTDPLGVRYRGRLELGAAGPWRVSVTVAGPEGPGALTFPVDVGPAGNGWLIASFGAGGLALLATVGVLWRRGRRRRLAGAALGLLLLATPAWPHASLVRSSPARRATLTTAPDRVQLWFNEAVEPKFSTVSVWDAAGQQVDLGDAHVEPEEPGRLTVGLKPLGRGTYRVRFRVLSVDGHVVESEFPFTLRP
jgi:methionine-rich copper-binding protein CopC